MNNRIPCAVTADLNRHLASLGHDAARETAVDEECASLMEVEYSPSNFQNIMEAISEMTEEVSGDIAAGVRSAIENKDTQAKNLCYQVIGKNVAAFVEAYWKKLATVQAESNIEQSGESTEMVAAANAVTSRNLPGSTNATATLVRWPFCFALRGK